MELDPIPLCDGEPSGSAVIPEKQSDHGEEKVRCRRRNPRKAFLRVRVCFSPEMESGRTEHVECPMLDLSPIGMAVEFDHHLTPGTRARISYSTISHQPVLISCTVRRCSRRDDGRYIVGLKLDRRLSVEECRPALSRQGRQVGVGVHVRKIKDLVRA
jgi:hypothetical protein